MGECCVGQCVQQVFVQYIGTICVELWTNIVTMIRWLMEEDDSIPLELMALKVKQNCQTMGHLPTLHHELHPFHILRSTKMANNSYLIEEKKNTDIDEKRVHGSIIIVKGFLLHL